MWSFLISAGLFLALVLGLGLWQYRTRKTTKHAAQQVDQEIFRAAEIAQRRHVQRFGKENTGLHDTLSGKMEALHKGKVHPS